MSLIPFLGQRREMYAPRAKFERIYIVSPIKVAIIFLTILHCIFLLITLLTSFWIKTKYGYYGPLYSCEKRLDRESLPFSIITVCGFGRSFHHINVIWMPIMAPFIFLSFVSGIISIAVATLSLVKNSLSTRRRYWLSTIILLLFIFLLDCFVTIFVPLSHHHQVYYLEWAYGVHCGATLFISVSSIAAILMLNTDDIQYMEAIDESSIDK